MKKKHLLTFTSLACALTCALGLAACGDLGDGDSGNSDVVTAVESVTLNKTTLTLEIGETETLTVTVKPDDATDKSVTWQSSAPSIASVDNAGKVTAQAAGDAKITATAGEKKAECNVTVNVAATHGLEYNALKVNEEIVAYSVKSIGTATDTALVIPASHEGKPVVAIERNAFSNNTAITSVLLSENVVRIEDSAFSGCTSLQFATYDNAKYLGVKDNPYYALIEKTDTSITSCILHDNVILVACGAFYQCQQLKTVSIPDGIKYVGLAAFKGTDYSVNANKNLEYATYGGLKYLGNSENPYLVAVDYVETKDMPTRNVHEKTKVLGDRFIYGYYAYTAINIPVSVKYIGYRAFYLCTELANINYGGTQEQFDAIEKGLFWNATQTQTAINYLGGK